MDQLTISDRLYGREREVATLLASFERISAGHGEILFVPGHSGAGKTALVQELQKPIRDRNGFFVQGKFDQYQQNVPYFAIRQAFTELCRELQSGDAQQRSRFKADILEAVGKTGQVLVELVPEFESFLGTQPPLEDISPQEARHRFAGVCRDFLSVICLPEHPLVLFIDDWQWADAASCELLKELEIGSTLRFLVLIVSYRDNEVHAGHPLMVASDDLRSRAVPVEVIPVANIATHDVLEIVADTLRPAAAELEDLAALIYRRTLGNPFFVRSFLGYLHEFGLIWFEEARNCWMWQLDRMSGGDLPDDLVDLFVRRLRRLDHDTQSLFSLASCLGNRFGLDTLSIISGRDPGTCLKLLFSGQAGTMLLPLDGDDPPEGNAGGPITCSFLHDQVQQAAYSLMEPGDLPSIRLEIGRQLLASLPPDRLAARLFDVVSDLNAGRHLLLDPAEQVQLVELNILAGRKAYTGTGYRMALRFYRAANAVLDDPELSEELWRDSHALMIDLLTERAVCEFLEGTLAEGEDCIRRAVGRARTAVEKAAALNVLIVQYTLLARYPEAIAAGREALGTLGINLPEEGYEEARNDEIALVRQELGSRQISSLTELPAMSDPEMVMASQILIAMGPPCYRSDQRLWSVMVPKVVNLTLRYGNIPQVGYSHTAFGGLLGWVDSDFAMAREFAELATDLMMDTFRTPSHQSVFYLMIGSSIRHWFKHLRYGTQDYADAYDIGLRSGNLQYAAYAFGHDMYCRFYQGAPLADLIQETERSLVFSRSHVNQWAIDLLEGGLHIFSRLSGGSPEGEGDDSWSEEEYLERVGAHRNIQVTCIYQVLKGFSLLVSGDFEAALALSDKTEPLIYTVGTQGLLPWPEHVFGRVLILTALYAGRDEAEQSRWRAELERLMGRLRIWADNCPENFEHKYLLAAAESARINGRPVEAMQLYDRVVEGAQAGDFVQWEALANERASAFWLEQGNERLAHAYWLQAYVCYDRWGAGEKTRSMETEYRKHLSGHFPAPDESGTPAEALADQSTDVFLERQIGQLRKYAIAQRLTSVRVEATTRAEELARAMQRVRVEIAQRKRAEEALRVSERRFRGLFENLLDGFALHEIVVDDAGRPVDYIFLEINEEFERQTGLRREAVIGQRVTEVMPGIENDPADWIGTYGKLALGGEVLEFEQFAGPLGKWFKITAYSPEENQFATVFEDITERKRAEEEVENSRDRLRELTARLDEVREDERVILARELHDDVGQNLTAMRLELSMIEQEIPTGWERVSNSLHSMIAITQDSVDRVNRLSKELRSPILDMLGLADAVESEVWDYEQRWGTETSLEMEIGELESFTERDLAIFKLLKESLSNVSRHAQAGRVEVSLRVVGRDLVLEVLDNGIGITVDQTQGSKSFGLMGMRERAVRLGGEFEVQRRDEGGTRVRVSIPVTPKK